MHSSQSPPPLSSTELLPISFSFPSNHHHHHHHSESTPSPIPPNFGRPRVRGLLKTARRSRHTHPPPSDHTASSPPTPPPTNGDSWDYVNAFCRSQVHKRRLGNEKEERDGDPWTSPDPFSEFEYDSDSSAASLSRHHLRHSHLNHNIQYLRPRPHRAKRRRGFSDDTFDLDSSPPTSTDEHDLSLDEETIYWDYSRKCDPKSEKKDTMWKTRSKLMDTSSLAGSRPYPMGTNAQALAAAKGLEQLQTDRKTTDLEDWEDLKEMFANAAQKYESQPHSEAILLLRGVINECSRFMQLFHDPSIIYTSTASSSPLPSSHARKSAKDLVSGDKTQKTNLSASTSTSTEPKKPENAAPASSETATAPKPADKKCKCKDLPTAFYTVLGTTLFFFGNIIDTSPELCQPGEPSNPVVYWLAALDAFEIGDNLPIRTNGRNFSIVEHAKISESGGRQSPVMKSGKSFGGYQSDPYNLSSGFSPPPEDWRMAVVWGRTLVSVAEELVRRQNERAKNPVFVAAQKASLANQQRDHERLVDALFTRSIVPQMPVAPAAPFAYGMPSYPFSVSEFFGGPRVQPTSTVPNNNADTPTWPPDSPLGTLLSRRPPVPKRLSLDSGVTPHQLLVLAQDQFSRGILHMPHPRHTIPARSSDGGAKDMRPVSAFLQPPGVSGHSETGDASGIGSSGNTMHAPSELPTFSRAKELYAIAYEVLLLSEKLEAPAEREQWARWANSVFSQMKMEADTDVAKWRGLITGARGRCFVVVGTALAEGVEDRLEAGEESEKDVLESEDAIDARDALNEAMGYLEKAKDEFEAKMALEAQGGVVIVDKDGEEGEDGDGNGDEDEDEDEDMVVLENEEEEEEEEDSVGDATPKPGPASTSSMLKPTESPSSKPTSTAAAATSSTSPAVATKNANTTEEEIEELKMLLAEVLVSLANLTANKREREHLYQRAQAESGDRIMLDSDDDDDEKMDETDD